MDFLPYNSETMRWIFLKLAEKNYYYIAYRFSTFYLTFNFSFFLTLNSIELRFLLLLCFLLVWSFLTVHRACMDTRAYALTHGHTYACIHKNTRVSRHSNQLTLERTHPWTNSHSKHSHLHAFTLARTHNRTHLHSRALNHTRTHLLTLVRTYSLARPLTHSNSNALSLEDTSTRTHSHSKALFHAVTLTHIHLHAGDLPVHSCMYARTFVQTQNCTHSLTIPHAFTHTHTHMHK